MGFVFRAVIGLHRALYRATGGRIGGRRGTVPILLLTTVGRKTRKRRTVPLQYLAQAEALVVVASNGGRPKHPAWFLNLHADPSVEVEIGRKHSAMRAREATLDERTLLWPQVVELWSGYDDYQRNTSREIPLVILEGTR
jgi:deazaflavin-dependent oxidoreductase (nitroreductase family)